LRLAFPYSIPISGVIRVAGPSESSTANLPRTPSNHGDSIFVGTSGWAYATWKPDFYPPKLSQKKFLEHYATRLNSVEVNYTFRSLPSPTITESWLAAVGDDFRFSFKAPQRVTHILRLKECSEAIERFATVLTPFVNAGRMGLILCQLPPNFKADLPRLDTFLRDAQNTGLRLAFEFRHASWFSEDVFQVLRQRNAALCVAESDDLQTPNVSTAPFACYRFRRSDYSLRELQSIAERLRAKSGEVFAYFKHEDEPTGALNAVRVREIIR
jgi:uncharacterized protein YecE (DUF72 family)